MRLLLSEKQQKRLRHVNPQRELNRISVQNGTAFFNQKKLQNNILFTHPNNEPIYFEHSSLPQFFSQIKQTVNDSLSTWLQSKTSVTHIQTSRRRTPMRIELRSVMCPTQMAARMKAHSVTFRITLFRLQVRFVVSLLSIIVNFK